VTELVKTHSATSARLPDFVEPMKAKLIGSMPSGDWIYEIKFDGYRAMAVSYTHLTLPTICSV